MWAQDEDEDWGRWRDVIFRAKGALTPHGIEFQPPPPQNRRKRGGPAFIKDPWKAQKAQTRSSADVEGASTADAEIQNPEPASEPEAPVQLTTSEALSKLKAVDVNLAAQTAADTTTEVASTTPTENTTYCPECYTPLHPDPKPERLYIFLHALRYTTSLGCFETEMPEWAAEGWEWDQS